MAVVAKLDHFDLLALKDWGYIPHARLWVDGKDMTDSMTWLEKLAWMEDPRSYVNRGRSRSR